MAVPWVALGVGVVLLAPLWFQFFRNLWTREPYQFFPLAIAAALLLAVRTWQESDPGPARPAGWVRWTVLIPAVLVTVAAGWLGSPWTGMVGAWLLAAALAVGTGGWRRFRAFGPALVMFGITLPPPFGMEENLTRWLRVKAVQMSSRILDAAGVPHVRNGNILDLPVREIMVEEACSGINSTLSVAAAAVFYHLWLRRPWWWLAVTLPLSLVFVFAGNTARIAGGSMLLQGTGIDLFKIPFAHEFVALVVIAVCLLLVVSLDQLLVLVTRRPAEEVVGVAGAGEGAELPARWWLPFAGIAGVLGVAMLPLGVKRIGGTPDLYEVQPSGLPQPDTFRLPAVLGGWQQMEAGPDEKSFVEMNGVLSRVWRYRRGQEAVAVALDYPFHGLHDVTMCYANAGWESVSRRELALMGEKGNGSVQHLQRARDEHALLIVSTVSADGRFIENDNLKGTLLTRFGDSVDVPMAFRIQLFASATSPIPGVAEEGIAGLFQEAHAALIVQLRERGIIARRRQP